MVYIYHGIDFRKQYFDTHDPFYKTSFYSRYDHGYEFQDIFEDTYYINFWYGGDWTLEFHKYNKNENTLGYRGRRKDGISTFKNSDISNCFTRTYKCKTFKEFCINDGLYPTIFDVSENNYFYDSCWIEEVKDLYYNNVNPYKLGLKLIIDRKWSEVVRHECIYYDGNFMYTLIEFDDCYIGIYKDTS